MANQMDLGSNGGENAAEFRRIRSYGIPMYQPLGETDNEESKGGGNTSIHFNGSTENIELLLHMVFSVNQLSLYGAVADMIAALPVDQRVPGKSVASGQLDRQEIFTQPLLAEMQANDERQGNQLQEYE